jgi:sporulation protein YunB
MIRNSILYHRLWYVRRRNFWKIRIFAGMFFIILSCALITSYAQKNVIPYLEDISESKLKAVITGTVNRVIADELASCDKYNDIVILNRDNLNNVTSIQTDIKKTNKLSAEISSKVQEALLTAENEKSETAAGKVFGNSFLDRMGYNIHVDILPYGNVETEFKSEFLDAGSNLTCHKVYVQVKVEAIMMASFMKKKTELITNIPVAETIIIGKIPESSAS